MEKIVVLTGSFNPITKAHYLIMSNAINKLDADKGLFIITSDKYLNKKMVLKNKDKTNFILKEDIRKEMINSLKSDNIKIGFGGVEIGGDSPSTYKTLKRVKKENPNSEVFFLVGADKVRGIPNWINVDGIINEFNLVVHTRSDIDLDKVINEDDYLKLNKDKIKIITLDGIEDISSTKIRNKFFNNEDYKDLMNDGPYKIMSSFNKDDFKPITEEDIIKYQILYGGRFGQNAARIQVFKNNSKIFNNWNNEIFGNKNEFLNNTKVYTSEFKVDNINNKYDTSFNVFNDDCSIVANNLLNEGLNPCILNLASNIHPCGGYNKGLNAQEESLCYMSNLSQSLYQFGDYKFKYIKDANVGHIDNVYPLNVNYGGIYTKDVTFFRHNIDKFYELSKEPFKCSVVTVASLSNRMKNDYTNDESIFFNVDGTLNKEGYNIERNKIRTIFRIALVNNHDSIVLGAFGCGVYNLLPSEISNLFEEVLSEEEFKDKFKKIVFAIYEGKGSYKKTVGKYGKFKPFYDIFSNIN